MALQGLWQKQGSKAPHDDGYKAIARLAALVVGPPFFFKAARMAWCAAWSSLLHTWSVARGFAEDNLERAPPLPADKLCFDALDPELGSAPDLLVQAQAAIGAHNDCLQKTGYTLLTKTEFEDGLLTQLDELHPQMPEFLARFTRPHLARGQLRFCTVPQPLAAAPGDYLCNHVLVNLHTTEVRRFLVPRPSSAALLETPIDELVSALQTHARVLLDGSPTLRDVLAYTRRLMSSDLPLIFRSTMEQLAEKWACLERDNLTLYIACDPALVTALVQQKAAFRDECQRLE
jgi:hypothetical protein